MDREWKQLMIDIECAGTKHDSAIMGLGGAFFDLHTMEIGPTIAIPVHVATSVEVGMRIYPDAFLWWLRQSNEARNFVSYNLVDIRVALDQFSAWCAQHSVRRNLRVWGNSSRFDLGITSFAYDCVGKEMPWGFGLETCFRTVRNMNSVIPYDPTARASTHHNPLDDALFQIEHLFKIKRHNDEHPRHP